MMYMDNDVFMGRSLEKYGESHYHEIEFLKKLVSEGDVVIDAGANIGVVSIPLAQAVGKDGYLVAVEPQPMIYNILCGNIALNHLQNVTPINRALADIGGVFTFMPAVDYSAQDNFGGIAFSPTQERKDQQYAVTLTVDDLNVANPKLIKMDVEGHEYAVLLGAKETILRAKPYLYIEFYSNRRNIMLFLKEIGYQWMVHHTLTFNENNFSNDSENVFLNEQGLHLSSLDIVCWPQGQDLGVNSPFLIDVDTSPVPMHKEIKRIKDGI